MNRSLLADIAENLAGKCIVGDKEYSEYMEIMQWYPENSPEEFYSGWCAAFIYHCCREAGMNLPVGTSKTARRGKFRWFCACVAWVEWAQTLGYWHDGADFTPKRGDIVVFNNIIPPEKKMGDSEEWLWCDHMGVVLSCNELYILTAEGNADNDNVSAIVRRKRNENIGGYIRIKDNNIYDDYPVTTEMSSSITFRPMYDSEEDKAQLLEWLSNPTVTELGWNERAPWDLKKIDDHFCLKTQANSRVTPWFIEMHDEPIGYIQYYPVQMDSYRFNNEVTFEMVRGGYGIDLMLGYPGLWNKGLGSRIIRRISEYIIVTFKAAVVCAAPEENNKRFAACLLKAGFLPLGKVENYDELNKQSVLMAYRRS